MFKKNTIIFKENDIKGNALLMMLPFLIFMLIFGYALIKRTSASHTQSYKNFLKF